MKTFKVVFTTETKGQKVEFTTIVNSSEYKAVMPMAISNAMQSAFRTVMEEEMVFALISEIHEEIQVTNNELPLSNDPFDQNDMD